jgi:ribosomal protein S18 acetylase RimI-like enzyme
MKVDNDAATITLQRRLPPAFYTAAAHLYMAAFEEKRTPNLSDLAAHDGLGHALIKVGMLAPLSHHPGAKELYIASVAVAEAARVIAYAQSAAFDTLTLDVADTNPRAFKLYQRPGFEPRKHLATPDEPAPPNHEPYRSTTGSKPPIPGVVDTRNGCGFAGSYFLRTLSL